MGIIQRSPIVSRRERNTGWWSLSLVRVFLILFALASMPASAEPSIGFTPESIGFDTVAVGATVDAKLFVYNSGDTTLLIRGLAMGGGVAFAVRDSVFVMAAGDTTEITLTFSPTSPGEQTDILVVSNNSSLEEALVSLVGVGTGPDIAVDAKRLVFLSPGIGRPVTVELQIRNEGDDTLKINDIRVSDSLFVVEEGDLSLAPGSTYTLEVIHTPVATGARIDTLTLVSNDFDEENLQVFLDVIGTPRDQGIARLGVVRGDSIAYPVVGDTISVDLILKTVEDVVDSVEVFFGFDESIFQPIDTDAPVTPTGHTTDGSIPVNQYFTDAETGRGIVHFSALVQAETRTQETLARISLVVVESLTSQTLLMVLNEEPSLNSNHLTASLEALALVPENRLVLGSAPPVIKPFPLLTATEDRSRSIALKGFVTDEDTDLNDLVWTFVDRDSLVVVSVSVLDSSVGPIARFFPPRNGYGAFRVTAIVTDPGGGRDSTVVVMEVDQVDDPPTEPQIKGPVDEATGLVMPVNFEWEGSDPDPDDALTYDFLLGSSDTTLEVSAQGLMEPRHALSGLAGDTDFFWKVVATDKTGQQTSGSIWKFSTALDQTAPSVLVDPATASQPTATSAELSWQTDEPTRSSVRYGPLSGFSDSEAVQELKLEDLATNTNVTLDDLEPNTEYGYQITHTDEAGNSTRGEIRTFTTSLDEDTAIPGDLNEDGFVNFTDFIRFAQVFGKSEGDEGFLPAADFGGNGQIGFDDFVRFSALYNQAGGI
jgi:hypothetical protein